MTSLQKKYTTEAINAAMDWVWLLPTEVQRKLKLAKSLIDSYGIVTCEEFSRQVGSHNWVLAKRTKRIVERYGDGVICLSRKEYEAAEIAAVESRGAIGLVAGGGVGESVRGEGEGEKGGFQ